MVSLLRRAVPDLALAVAAGSLVIVVGVVRASGSGGVTAASLLPAVGLGLLSGALIAASGLLARAGSRPQVSTVRLPGHPDPARPVTRTVTRTAAALVLLISGLAVATADPEPRGAGPLPLILAAVIGLAVAAALLIMVRRRTTTVGDRRRVTAALTGYAPRLVLYTSRENGAGYQLGMWLPLLERLGERFVVLVRHPAAQAEAARLTSAPVICAPLAADLEAAVVESLRVACYVNVVGGNANLVGYRSLCHVYLGHGDSDKEASIHPTHAMFDRIFIAGPAARERYRQAGLEIPDERFVVIGRPQLAGLTARTDPSGAPVVLLAPTWRGYNSRTDLSSLPYCRELADALLRRGVTVRFRPHPLSWQSPAERAMIDRVDALLRRDRASSGRPHRPAAESRGETLVEAFNGSDALITDVGALLVDWFATGRPYAVALSAVHPEPPETAAAAYLITPEQLRAADFDPVLDDLLGADPKRTERAAVAEHFLGELPPSDAAFRAAVRGLIEDRPRSATRPAPGQSRP